MIGSQLEVKISVGHTHPEVKRLVIDVTAGALGCGADVMYGVGEEVATAAHSHRDTDFVVRKLARKAL